MRKIKWGVLGTAGILARTAPGMQLAENCELYAIAGRSMEKAKEFQQKYGFKKVYDNYMELLEDPEVEAVYNPLPNTMHFEWTIKAMEHGKHVLCEKPMTPTAEETEALIKAAKEHNVFLMEAFAYQHSPYIAALDKEVQAGTIGDVKYIEAAYITSDYVPTNIRMRRDVCGGCTYDLGVYCTSLIQRIMKEEPEKIKASASFSDANVDYLTNVLFEYKNGVRATLTCGMILATELDQSIARFEIAGTKGSIKPGNFDFNAHGDLSYIVKALDGSCQEVVVPTPQNYCLEVEQLGRCILEGETPAVTAQFSMMNARTIDRILKEIGY